MPLLFGGYQGARLIHFSMTIGLLLFFFLHVCQVIRAGWNNCRAMITGYEIEKPIPIETVDEPRIDNPAVDEPVNEIDVSVEVTS